MGLEKKIGATEATLVGDGADYDQNLVLIRTDSKIIKILRRKNSVYRILLIAHLVGISRLSY